MAPEDGRPFGAPLQRAERLEALRRATLAITSALDHTTVLDMAIAQATQLLAASEGGIYHYDQQRDELLLVGHSHRPHEVGKTGKMGEGLAGTLIQTGLPYLIVPDSATWQGRAWEFPDTSAAVLGVPLKWPGEVPGVLFIADNVGRQFTPEDAHLLALFAEHVAIALASAARVQQLHDQQALFQRLVQSSPMGMIVADAGGHVIDSNGQALNILGYTTAELCSLSLEQLYADPRDARRMGIQLHKAAGSTAYAETYLKSRNGELVPIGLSATWLRDVEGHPVGIVGYFEDHRALHRREQQRALFHASLADLAFQAPETVLQAAVEEVYNVTQATWVRAFLLNERGLSQQVIVGTERRWANPQAEVRPDGISIWVVNRREAMIIPNTREYPDENLNPLLKQEDVWAAVCLPLLLPGRCLGVMWLHYTQPRDFSRAEVKDWQLYVNQVALAYENAQRWAERERMRQAAETLANTTDWPQTCQQIVQSARNVLQADWAILWPYDTGQGQFLLESSAVAGLSPDLLGELRQAQPLWEELGNAVMLQGWLAVQEDQDVQQFTTWGPAYGRFLKRLGAASSQGITLTVGAENVGVLYLHYKQPQRFGEEQQKTSQTFAHYAARALQTARLFAQIRRAQNAAQVVARATALGHRDVMLAVAQGTKEAMDCAAVILYEYDVRTDTLAYPPRIVGISRHARRHLQGPIPVSSRVWAMLDLAEPKSIEELAPDELSQDAYFVSQPDMQSGVAIPLRAASQQVGLMFALYRMRHRVTTTDLTVIEFCANQAAVAIHYAQLYAQAGQRAQTLEALQAASHAVTSSLEMHETLTRIAQQACALTSDAEGHAGWADIWLVEGTQVKLAAAYPIEEFMILQAQFPEGLGPQGIIARALRKGASQRVGDITRDADYVTSHRATRSELAVPIKVAQQVIGVMNVEHVVPNAFTKDDEDILQLLASQAGIAIQQAQARTLVDARTAVAWVGLTSALWGHGVRRDAATLRDLVGHLRYDLSQGLAIEELTPRLDLIDEMAKKIREIPITAPLPAEDILETVSINDLLQERLRQLQVYRNLMAPETHELIQYKLVLDRKKPALIKVSTAWLKRALDRLVDNAVEAMAEVTPKVLTVTTRIQDTHVQVLLSDTGRGIPEEVQRHLFKEPISKLPGSHGTGVGLLLAQTIVHAYGGDIRLGATGPAGTTMIISLPLAG